jgi:hypothetical protein
MLKHIIFYSIIISLFYSCRFNENIQGTGADFLQGKWTQDSVEKQNSLINYSLHQFRFSCDSFFVQIQTFSKVKAAVDTCMHGGEWKEYAIGTYRMTSDTLYLKGFFATPEYIIKEDGCLRKGIYEEAFVIRLENQSQLQLNGLYSTIPLKLRLQEKSICEPKPL